MAPRIAGNDSLAGRAASGRAVALGGQRPGVVDGRCTARGWATIASRFGRVPTARMRPYPLTGRRAGRIVLTMVNIVVERGL